MYSKKDIPFLKEKIHDIAVDAEIMFKEQYMQPTFTELEKVYKIIKDFIIKNKRIVYGGYAQNSLIKSKDKMDVFYDKYDLADIEFYTPKPIEDGMKLAKLLHDSKYEYVQLAEGVHNETYKLFANFHNYCDISYMPENVFKKIPTVKIENMNMAHPHFMMIDAYRVYTDLLTSNFRLTKSFSRFSVLNHHYPFDEVLHHNKLRYQKRLEQKESMEIKKFIKQKILQNSKYIVIGHEALNYYLKKSKMDLVEFPYYQIVVDDYENDVKNIHKILKSKYKKNISSTEFFPFSQFYGRHIDFYYKKQVILKVYYNNNRCVPFRKSEAKLVKYGTSQTLMMYFLIEIFYNKVNNFIHEEENFEIMLAKLITARNKYLKKYRKSVLDDTPFREFTIECLGSPLDQIRHSRLMINKRVKEGKKAKFEYFPNSGKHKIPEYKFDNTSGNTIKSEKLKTKLK